jgi:hypothetical protein
LNKRYAVGVTGHSQSYASGADGAAIEVIHDQLSFEKFRSGRCDNVEGTTWNMHEWKSKRNIHGTIWVG